MIKKFPSASLTFVMHRSIWNLCLCVTLTGHVCSEISDEEYKACRQC
jgi:hypothetical protein